MSRYHSANIKVNGEDFRIGEWGDDEKGIRRLMQDEINNVKKKVKKPEYIAEFVLKSLASNDVGLGEIGSGKFLYPTYGYEATIDKKGKLDFRKTHDGSAFQEHMELKAKNYKGWEMIETLEWIVKNDDLRTELRSLLQKGDLKWL